MTAPVTLPTRAERFEGFLLVLILLFIGGVSAAASFTHIHDWTMDNSPEGTGDWFGWANAIVSDLVPLGVGLEVRRRRRHGMKIGWYPIVVILAAAALSLAGQLAMATPSITGWLLAAVPALGFLALTKLVLSRPTAPVVQPVPAAPAVPVAVPVGSNVAPVAVPVGANIAVPQTAVAMPARSGPDSSSPTSELLPGARVIADAYRRATGHDINREALADRLRVPVHVAERLIDALTATEPSAGVTTTPARLNGALTAPTS